MILLLEARMPRNTTSWVVRATRRVTPIQRAIPSQQAGVKTVKNAGFEDCKMQNAGADCKEIVFLQNTNPIDE